MVPSPREIVAAQAMKLSPDERADLVDKLWLGLHSREEVDAASGVEIARSVRQIDGCPVQYGHRVAARLIRHFDLVEQMLMADPGLGTPGPGGGRTLPLRQFPYTLVYRMDGAVCHLVALRHHSRVPEYRAERLLG